MAWPVSWNDVNNLMENGGGSVPTKLSEFENDLFYVDKVGYSREFRLTDFTVHTDDANVAYEAKLEMHIPEMETVEAVRIQVAAKSGEVTRTSESVRKSSEYKPNVIDCGEWFSDDILMVSEFSCYSGNIMLRVFIWDDDEEIGYPIDELSVRITKFETKRIDRKALNICKFIRDTLIVKYDFNSRSFNVTFDEICDAIQQGNQVILVYGSVSHVYNLESHDSYKIDFVRFSTYSTASSSNPSIRVSTITINQDGTWNSTYTDIN